MRKIFRNGIAATALLLLAPQYVAAWGHTWAGAMIESAVRSLVWKLGPLKYNAALMVYNTGYNSDIFNGMRPTRYPDFISYIVPDLQILAPLSRKLILEVDEQPQYTFFLDNDKERAFNNIFAGRAHIVFDRWYFQASGIMSDIKQRINSELDIRARMKDDNAVGLAVWQLSKKNSMQFRYTTSRIRYENVSGEGYDISQNLDRNESYFSVGSLYQRHSDSAFYINAEYGTIDFSQTMSSYKNTRSYSIFAGWQFLKGGDASTSRFGGAISFGYNWFDLSDVEMSDFHGLVGNTNLTYALTRLTSLRVFLSRSPSFSVYSDMAFYVQTTVGTGFSHTFTRNLTFSYDIMYGRNTYRAGDGAEGGTERSPIKDINQTIRLTMRVRKYLILSMLGSLGNRRNPLAVQQNSSRGFIGIGITYGFPGLEPTVPTIIGSR